MNCPKCSAEIEEKTIICPQCGGFPAVELQNKKVEQARKKEVLLAFGRVFHNNIFLIYTILLTALLLPCIAVDIVIANADMGLFQAIIGVITLVITIALCISTVSAWKLFISKNVPDFKSVRNIGKYMSFRRKLCKFGLVFACIICVILFIFIVLVVKAIEDEARRLGTTFEAIAKDEFIHEIGSSALGNVMTPSDAKLLGFLFSNSAAIAIIGSLLMFAAIITFLVFKLKMYTKGRDYWDLLADSVQAHKYLVSTYTPIKSLYVWGSIEALSGLLFLKVNIGFSLLIIVGGAILIMQNFLFRAIDGEQQVAKGIIKVEEDELKKVQKIARDVKFQQEEEKREKEEQEKKRLAAQREQEEYERAKKAEKAKEEQREKEEQTQRMMQQMMQMMMLNNMKQQGDSNNNEKTEKKSDKEDK